MNKGDKMCLCALIWSNFTLDYMYAPQCVYLLIAMWVDNHYIIPSNQRLVYRDGTSFQTALGHKGLKLLTNIQMFLKQIIRCGFFCYSGS